VNPRSLGIQLVCAAAFVIAAASPSGAQSAQPPGGGNPFAGLFKGSPADQPHRLDLNGSTFVAWDDNVLAQAPNGSPDQIGLDPRGVRQGFASGFQAAASYGLHTGGPRNQFSADAQGSLQQFASTAGQNLLFESYGGSVGFRTGLTPKTTLSTGAGYSYAPFYQYAPFLQSTMNPESPVGSDYGYAATSEWVRTTRANAMIENRFSKRSRVSADVAWEQRLYPDNPLFDIDTSTVHGVFTHNLTKKLTVHVGYGLQKSEFKARSSPTPLQHDLDFGIGYGDGITISFARHYTLAMSIGASVVRRQDPFGTTEAGRETTFVVIGGATLSRSIGRTWATSIGYTRGTSYVVGFPQPMLTDSASAGIGGPIAGRLYFSAGAGATQGQQLFQPSSGSTSRLVSYTASTRLTFGLFKSLGLYTQASYYKYSVPEDFHSFGFTPKLDRRSVSAGLTAWLPLIKPPRTRRTDDPMQQNSTGQP